MRMGDCNLTVHTSETSKIFRVLCHSFFWGGGCLSYRKFYLKEGSLAKKINHCFVFKAGRRARCEGKGGARPSDVTQNNRLLDFGFFSY